MKTKFLLLYIGLAFTLSMKANTTLNVQDPQHTWNYYRGKIDSAILAIQPKSAYFQCDLYLTFSAPANTNSYYYYSDTFEVQLFFDLPQGSIVHDSWLWIGSNIVRADIIDRDRANLIYEGIVNRRHDPSILYKNSQTQYELRVFPLPLSQKRKVKITYLVPAGWGLNSVQIPLPLNILKASGQTPFFQIRAYTDSVWKNPKVAELPNIAFQTNAGNTYKTAVVPSAGIINNTSLNFSMPSPMQNGVFVGQFPTSATDGYYQLVMLPSQALKISTSKKAALLFDYEPSKSVTSTSDILTSAKQMLHSYFAPSDSFNLIFSQLNIYRASNKWLPCDSATIEYTFSHLEGGDPFSDYSSLPTLIGNGIDFLKEQGNSGELILIANSDNVGTPTIANELITDIQNLMSPQQFPIHILDYTDQNYSYNYSGNTYYLGNDYFYSNLSILTGGNYQRVLVPYNTYYNYYYYNVRPIGDAMNALFETLDGRINSFDAYTKMENGFCYGRYNSENAGFAYVNKSFIQLGRYHGNMPMKVDVTGTFGGLPFSQTFNMNNIYTGDEATKTMWIGNYIAAVEISDPDNPSVADVVDSSISNRVLSLYTAFLAVEPVDTTGYCATCQNNSSTDNNGNNTTGINSIVQDSLSLIAYPNPFARETKISIQLGSTTEATSLQIFDVLGRMVKTISLRGSGNEPSYTWSGDDDKEEIVSSGIYMIVLTTPNGRHTMKVIKE